MKRPNISTDDERQAGKPARLGDVLRAYVGRSGLRERMRQATVVDDWPRLVGAKIAAVCVPEAVTQEGTMFVRVTSSAWMQELHLMTPELLRLLEADGRKIRRIVWRAW